jgi:hypothetical protein
MKTFKTAKGTALPLIDMKGKDYLQVAQRLVWFREELPKWRIETELFRLEEKYAIAKATIRNESGDIMATAHKREDAGHFGDFIEKAETGALGRCLAYVGYGTQFCADELDEAQRIVDAPIESKPAAKAAKPLVKSVAPVKPAQEVQSESGEYRVTFGVYSGKSLDQIGEKTSKGYAQHLTSDAQKRGGNLGPNEAEFIKQVNEKFKSVTS